MRKSLLGLFAAFALVGMGTVAAHHSFDAEFDKDKPVIMKGKITRMDWINPHSWLYIDVVKDGKNEAWAIEFASPGTLISQRGWTRDMIVIGQTVTVQGFLAKDGSLRSNGSRVDLQDGKQLCASNCGPDGKQRPEIGAVFAKLPQP